MSIVTELQEAREKILKPEHWTKGTYARDATGKQVSSRGPEAVCWCALGALDAVDAGQDTVQTVYNAVRDMRGPSFGLTDFNDRESTTHEQVIGVFDRAIAAVKTTGVLS